ncbi:MULTISPECIES: HlyD family secretion protein [unclassified Vibrio]|uniref:HlyD family secretion protein n=1 Tax=unclassified Vibrio TaxID=2614977 RepID=UPI001361F0C8|nr:MULTISPECIES: biotin/lipoyl-binding protein [unclassified Vibrio]NAW56249.1 biotin/lipoyl-binding protein [Vibrio sp. V36_P2S2PM302]NAX27412.1 biotin/lipoyl-binding protein [Vibrio sp. V38_P2S17PM301]NAX31760.1 biotin/lipoyl-binding protein [Vibrio sp. V37_P2S8PM304]
METLIILSYIALCVVVFKVFRVPKNKWTLTTASVIGMCLVGWIFLYMAMYQPVSRMARVYSVTTPITSRVEGLITQVYIKGNVALKAGDPLYQIDPAPFQDKVERIESDIQRTDAAIAFYQSELDRYKNLGRKGFSSQESIDTVESNLLAQQAQKSQYQAQLSLAKFNLDATTVRAPTDGYVSQMALRPGMKSRMVPFQGNMTFVHQEDKQIFAAFKQSPARYIKVGYPAEVTFNTIPGHAYKAHVVQVNDIMAQGSFQPSGKLQYPEHIPANGRLLVKVELDEPALLLGMPVPAGADAHVAVYSPKWEMFSIVRKVILRMQSWQNWVFEG